MAGFRVGTGPLMGPGGRGLGSGKGGGGPIRQSGPAHDPMDPTGGGQPRNRMLSYKRGGKVKKTGPAKLHEGEVVIPKEHVQALRDLLEREHPADDDGADNGDSAPGFKSLAYKPQR